MPSASTLTGCAFALGLVTVDAFVAPNFGAPLLRNAPRLRTNRMSTSIQLCAAPNANAMQSAQSSPSEADKASLPPGWAQFSGKTNEYFQVWTFILF